MKAAEIRLCPGDRAVLESWARAPRTEQRRALRARLVLFAADGMATGAIAARLGLRSSTVSKWRGRFARLGLEGLEDAPRRGRPARYDAATEARLLAQLDAPPPAGYARWNGRLLAAALGDVSPDQVWRVLRAHRISLARRRSWCVSTDPEFAAKAADIVGLYLNPPEHAVVLCVDEKPHIQALERAQGSGCGCPTAKRSPALATATSATAPPPCSPPSRSPPAWSRPVTTGAAGAPSSSTS
jgi:transposase